MKAKTKEPVFKYKNGRRTAVVLDIKVYRQMLRRQEDAHDIKEVAKRRKTPGKYRPLEEVLSDFGIK
jgi:hypothetical protein